MRAPAHEVLEAARTQADVSFEDLWLAYFALGGAARPRELRSYLAGEHTVAMEYDLVAHALNEVFSERGLDHPVPYREDLGALP